ncbi:MAG: aminotransferase class V-fold PLP-dependent enzyme [Acidobacteriota bacterium]
MKDQSLALEKQARSRLWQRVIEHVEHYIEDARQAKVAPRLDPERVRAYISEADFDEPLDPIEAVDFAARGMWEHQVHVAHPRYFGLFNPTPTAMGIAADALAAAFNPQLAAWAHSPFAVELEQSLIRRFAKEFGFVESESDGTFATGGAEANHTAMLTALVFSFRAFAEKGVRGLERQPTLYVTGESHHSLIKAARACGLGTDAVRIIETDENLRMNAQALAARVAEDRAAGFAPFMVAATAGTTSAGVIDPLPQIADLALREKLWLHVDAAWGGAAILVPELRACLDGIERADSITLDAHKWLSVPVGAGVYLTRHSGILGETFRITADYVPKDADHLAVTDPYAHSIQWTRRFIGLKLFLSLAVAGWEGYRAALRHQTEMGDLLRRELEASGWKVINKTALPVVCFVYGEREEGRTAEFIERVAREVADEGEAWISATKVGRGESALRACITSYRTAPEDISALIGALSRARRKIFR